jgi:ubiquinone/menaquinone biosynthesis C-methylase UbiE
VRDRLKLSPPGERVLDVGAGSGVWSLAMCARSPGTRVTALDLPAVLPGFLDRAERLGLAERIEAIPGDCHSTELHAASVDRIVLANILHLESPAHAAALMARIVPALKRGGELVVIDCLAKEGGARETARAIYALHLAMRTDGGPCASAH